MPSLYCSADGCSSACNFVCRRRVRSAGQECGRLLVHLGHDLVDNDSHPRRADFYLFAETLQIARLRYRTGGF